MEQSEVPPEHWPPGVQQMNIGQIGMLGVDNENQLYWDGRPVEIRRRVSLSFWQAVGTFLIATHGRDWSCSSRLGGSAPMELSD